MTTQDLELIAETVAALDNPFLPSYLWYYFEHDSREDLATLRNWCKYVIEHKKIPYEKSAEEVASILIDKHGPTILLRHLR